MGDCEELFNVVFCFVMFGGIGAVVAWRISFPFYGDSRRERLRATIAGAVFGLLAPLTVFLAFQQERKFEPHPGDSYVHPPHVLAEGSMTSEVAVLDWESRKTNGKNRNVGATAYSIVQVLFFPSVICAMVVAWFLRRLESRRW